MREKLIDLIQSAVSGCATYWAGLIADALIAAGFVLPVRCKGCKYCDNGECTMFSEPAHMREYERWTVDVDENDFCSYGERRTDG